MDISRFSTSRGVTNQVWLDNKAPGRMRVPKTNLRISRSWYRGENCNFLPRKPDLLPTAAAYDHVLKGWLPETPKIDRNTKITAFGSCFASNITNWLNDRSYSVLTADKSKNAYVIQCGDGMVTTFTIRQQFEWALDNRHFGNNMWHGPDGKLREESEDVRSVTRDIFMNTEMFIITLGLSEIWYDRLTEDVFWRAIPASQFDPERHGFRVSSVAENKENITAIFNTIKNHRPEAVVLFTLSPIPLAATFRPISCITANSVSKAILRAALDEFMRESNVGARTDLYYWPSYELATELFADSWIDDRRHVRQEILDFIMTLFGTYWCEDSQLGRSIAETWAEARLATGTLPARFARLALAGREVEASQILGRLNDEDAALLRLWASERGLREKLSCGSWFRLTNSDSAQPHLAPGTLR
jgi:hypothetical protein